MHPQPQVQPQLLPSQAATHPHARTWYPVSLASMEGQKGMMPRERRSTYSSAAAMTEGRQLRKAMSVRESHTWREAGGRGRGRRVSQQPEGGSGS